MRLLDPKVQSHLWRYILQSLLGGMAVGVILFSLNIFTQTAIIASLGATTFILFTMPHLNVSKSPIIIGGYVIGIACGCFFHILPPIPCITPGAMLGIYGALSIASATFIMVVVDKEHPPAAAVALAFVLNEWSAHTVIGVFCGVLCLCFIKRILKPTLMNLL